ncbi:hypothetical protein E4U60_000570 [Claviceps pazoutovae]|uniref:Uncharacterized protein n=1 Tax=Claviceps pazoutovae TaxID=1649127 RepID=A0A9P7ME93_9HYPO|nr:hypothetical protein E4U60_000570 [Claviceps pazoutovae]
MAIVQKNSLTNLQQHKTTLMMQMDLRGRDDGKKQKETSSSVGMAQWGSTELDHRCRGVPEKQIQAECGGQG